MKLNKEEMRRMISQIDDDLLYEAAEEYHTSHFSGWKRVIPVAACITLLVLGAAAAVLKNITIDRSHESIEGTIISEHKGDTEDTLSDSEESYVIQIDSSENAINSILDLITASFGEKGVSEKLVIQSMEIRLLPKDNSVLNGKITLTDTENLTDITVSISKSKIIIDMEAIDAGNTLQEETDITIASASGDTALKDSASGETISRINWYDFYKAAEYVPEITKKFPDSQYMLLHAELVASIYDIDNIPENIPILAYDGELKTIENREELKDMPYSYTFFIETSVVPDTISNDFLVYIK